MSPIFTCTATKWRFSVVPVIILVFTSLMDLLGHIYEAGRLADEFADHTAFYWVALAKLVLEPSLIIATVLLHSSLLKSNLGLLLIRVYASIVSLFGIVTAAFVAILATELMPGTPLYISLAVNSVFIFALALDYAIAATRHFKAQAAGAEAEVASQEA